MSLTPVAPLYLGSSRCARPLPRGVTGHVAHPSRSIETHSLPTLTRCFPRSFTFYVADPVSSIVSRQLPLRSTATSRLYRPCRSPQSLHWGIPTFRADQNRFCVVVVLARAADSGFA